ncbi:hypothetical protein GCM10010420_04710 [Streptomyces glaucosporus]|uniref:Gram-positive cocci surface proteins LPxTG domain-containing protein n=1 Tax=Streptomyces glaucosporus TaxID=284044 RepID=A0ABP5US33_9ACTN
MRILSPASAVTAAAAACLLLAPAAYATPPVKGDNGTVKIHDSGTGEELPRNEPKVCEFYLDAFKFDAGQEVTWTIYQHPPTGRELAEKGTITLDEKGHGRTADMTLPDGHYKLEWTFEGENGKAKHKVFWTDCGDSGTPGEPGEPGGPDEPNQPEEPGEPGEPDQPGEPGEPDQPGEPNQPEEPGEPGEPDQPGEDEEAPPADTSDDGGNLAETGSSAPVAGMAAAAAALLGAGSYLIVRRRKAARN